LKQLLSVAISYRIKVRVVRRVGQFVPVGTPLLMVNKVERLSSEAIAALRGTFDFGPTRTLQQDVEFGKKRFHQPSTIPQRPSDALTN
jgi:uncharacterized membrane protein